VVLLAGPHTHANDRRRRQGTGTVRDFSARAAAGLNLLCVERLPGVSGNPEKRRAGSVIGLGPQTGPAPSALTDGFTPECSQLLSPGGRRRARAAGTPSGAAKPASQPPAAANHGPAMWAAPPSAPPTPAAFAPERPACGRRLVLLVSR